MALAPQEYTLVFKIQRTMIILCQSFSWTNR